MGVMRLGFVQVRVTDMEAAKSHYIDALGLEKTAEVDGRLYLKGWDEWDHHSVVVEPGGAGLVKMAFKVDQEEDLSELEKRIEAYGLPVRRVHRHEDYAVGEGIVTTLPSGHVLQLYHEIEVLGTRTGRLNPDPWPDDARGMAAPRIDHLLVTAENPGQFTEFFTKVLDFKISERVVPQAGSDEILGAWLYRTNTPHDIAVIPGPNGKLHHFAFWLDNWQDVLRAGDIMAKTGIPVDIGPTRHGITRGTTIYFFDPAGNRNEVFSGGYITYPDFPCITWTADELGKGIFYIQRELNDRFTTVLT
ncbi:MAG: catechol 2,3-dioxygenase [Firmicutes bacterium]|nr:catechol 2,3-dioxygenase [Bacillota bacterium]